MRVIRQPAAAMISSYALAVVKERSQSKRQTFDSSWVLSESSKSCCSFIFDGVRSCVKQFKDTLDISCL